MHTEITGQAGNETYCVSADAGADSTLTEVSVFRGNDGALVVQIDTNDDTGRIRVNVNDGAVFDGDCESGERFDLR